MNDILKRITSLMNAKNWTLYKLAKESDIPYSSLNSMFQKNNQPTISTLEKVCRAFNITMSEFFSNTPLNTKVKQEFSKVELELIQTFQNLTKNNQKLLIDFANLLQNR